MNTLFKSQNSIQNKVTELHTFVNRSRVIEETYKNTIHALVIFMAMKEIPQFRIWKQSMYYKALTTYCSEVSYKNLCVLKTLGTGGKQRPDDS